jgi:GH15 family glucan-1,4-alpha-glucosidase
MRSLDYGAVGNCRSAALISNEGSVDWLCFPDFDSPSIFAKILDKEKGGSLSFIVDPSYNISQKYVEHTNILSTYYESEEGAFEVLDFMPRYKIGEFNSHYIPPELYRIIRLKKGAPRFCVSYDPILNYAKEKVLNKSGQTFVKTISKINSRDTIYLYAGIPFDTILNRELYTLEKDTFILVSYNQKLIPINQDRVELEFQRTRVYWLDWANRTKKYTKFNDCIERSVLVLKLMSYQRTGAVLAALTTSIPESIGDVRNWDYRFCWLRDASMSIKTLLSVGHKGAASSFMGFIKNILKSKNETFQIMYDIRGRRLLTEETLPNLSGFFNSRPVRIGNEAYLQRQNDSLGYLMDVIYQYYVHFPGTLNEIEEIWEVVKNIIKTIQEDWKKPDNGIWEIRGKSMNFVHSKIMCWVAFDRAHHIATILHETGYATRWCKAAKEVKEDVFIHGWKEEIQSFSQTYENKDLDSSLLLMEPYGFISADDERYVKTVKAIQKNLMYKGLLYRYKNVDDFGTPTSAFTICTFWLVRALFSIGEKAEALELFERMITYANHLQLFSEDLDFETKDQYGNFPQAYSHLALINTALLFTEEVEISKFIRP